MLPYASLLTHPQRFLGARDLARSFLPAKIFELNAWLHHGQLPKWNPFIGGGKEFLADLSYGPLYLLNLVLYAFGIDRVYLGFSWFIALHSPLIFLSAFLFLRAFYISRKEASLFALLYALSGLTLTSSNVPNILACLGALPLYFGCLQLAFARKNKLALLGASIAMAWPLYAGAPDFCLFLAFATPLAFFSRLRAIDSWIKLLLVAAVATLLVLPQVIPFWSLFSQANRNELSVEETLFQSFHPARLLEFFLPEIYGNYFPENTYWGSKWVNGPMTMPILFNCYLGFFLPALSLWALSARRKKILIPLFVAILLALGAYGGLYEWLARNIRLWRTFRYPEKAILFAALTLLLWEAKGFKRMLADFRRQKVSRAMIFAQAGLSLAAILSAGLFSDLPTVKNALLIFCLFQGIFTALLWLKKRGAIESATFFALLALLFFTDLFRNSVNYVWDQPTWILENPAAALVKADLAARSSNLEKGAPFRISANGARDENFSYAPENLDAMGKRIWLDVNMLTPNTASLFELSDITWYNGIYSQDRARWWKNLENNPQRLHDLMSVYYLLEIQPRPGFRVNPSALPFVSVPAAIEFQSNFDSVLEQLKQTNWDHQRSMILEAAPFSLSQKAPAAFQVRRALDEIQVSWAIKSPEPLVVLVNETFSRHWKCTPHCEVVGRANGWAIAVRVEAESEGFRLRYE